MIGNLVDNACKWAQSQVHVEVLAERRAAGDRGRWCGSRRRRRARADAAERAQVAQRGQRLDETKPGSGLGLSIVIDLARLYGGDLTLAQRRSAACGPNWCCRRCSAAHGTRSNR